MFSFPGRSPSIFRSKNDEYSSESESENEQDNSSSLPPQFKKPLSKEDHNSNSTLKVQLKAQNDKKPEQNRQEKPPSSDDKPSTRDSQLENRSQFTKDSSKFSAYTRKPTFSSDDFDDYDDEDFDDEVRQILTSTFKGKISKQQIDRLSTSLSLILERAADDLSSYPVNNQNNFTKKASPAINLILPASQFNSSFMQPTIVLPPPIISNNSSNRNTYSQNTSTLPNPYPNVMQNPFLPSPNPQLNPYLPNPQLNPYLPDPSSNPYLPNISPFMNPYGSTVQPYPIFPLLQQDLGLDIHKKKKKDKKKKDKKKKDKKAKKQDGKDKKQDKKGDQDEKKDDDSIRKSRGTTYDYDGSRAFSGIFRYFRSTNWGSDSVSESQVIATASSTGSGNPRELMSGREESSGFKNYFNTRSEANSWICFDFKSRRVIPSAYSIKTIKGNPNHFYPKSWVIEGSNNNSIWQTIDSHNNCSFLKGNNITHVFRIAGKKTKAFRYIRMRLTGPNWNDTFHLGMESFEIFGTLIES